MRRRVGDGEAERDQVEEWRLGRFHAPAAKIVPRMEDELKPADPPILGADQRRVGAPVCVGQHIGDEGALPPGREFVKFDPHPSGRPAAGDVENVGRQAGQIILPRQRQASSGATLSWPSRGGHRAGCACKFDMAAAPFSAIANSASP